MLSGWDCMEERIRGGQDRPVGQCGMDACLREDGEADQAGGFEAGDDQLRRQFCLR